MKKVFLLLILSSCIPVHPPQNYVRMNDFNVSNCPDLTLIEEIRTNDIVVIAEVLTEYDHYHNTERTIKVRDFFKGKGQQLLTIDPGIHMEPGELYLIFAYKPEKYYFIDPCSRTKKLSLVSEEDLDLLMNKVGLLPCVDEAIRSTPKGSCTREYAPVCGCDGYTYGNPCAAYQNGIMIYSRGVCQ